ncbi:MAG: carbohydrate ABC transporter permease [Ruthenibacterium lactatiformans]|nr:carbohydrate ABC transporter permease [Ruthenibacterium lactatiformans]
MVIKETRSDKIFNFINYFLLACVFLICLYPLWFIIIASISNPDLVNGGQVWFWPKDISFDGYKSLFADDGVMRGYVNTLIYTTGGTLINLAVTLPAAYALSRRDFVGRKFFTLMFLFTMFFSGGLIPTFLTVKSLGLYNNPWVMVILGATSMTNIIISRTFFETNIPNELREAAEIDGCSNTRFFFSIVLPLSGPILAVMVLFYGVAQWNSWFPALLYISDRGLYPLQMVLREVLIQSDISNMAGSSGDVEIIGDGLKYATMVVATLPIMCLYPFLQKYFVKGVMIGAVKG